MSHQLYSSSQMSLPIGGLSTTFSWPGDFIVHRFCKLGFFLVSFNATLALVGQLCKTLHHDSLGSVPISSFPIHTFQFQWHAMFLLNFIFTPRMRVTKCPWRTFSCHFEINITQKMKARSTRHRLHWSLSMPLPLGTLSTSFSFPSNFIVHRFHKLGFF